MSAAAIDIPGIPLIAARSKAHTSSHSAKLISSPFRCESTFVIRDSQQVSGLSERGYMT
jgi:hypothetical protein